MKVNRFSKEFLENNSWNDFVETTGDEYFEHRFKSFKDYLKKTMPTLTMDELLKFDLYMQELKSLYSWNDIHYLLAGLEFEKLKKR